MLARLELGVALGLSATALLLALACGEACAQEGEPQASEGPRPEPTPEAVSPPAPQGELAPSASDSKNNVGVEVAGEATYVTPPIRGGATPFGAGLGARAGLDISGFYVGVSVLDFFGAKDVDVSYRALLYGVEVGYGVRIPAFASASWVLRPRLGAGNAAVDYTDPSLAADVVTSASGTSAASDTLTVNNVYLQPGVTLELASGGHFAAIDGSMLVLPGIAYGGADRTTWISYGGQLQLGFCF